jgi:sugar O-acyltransferase (sialic acid O-acetyltransferase NeuD family)
MRKPIMIYGAGGLGREVLAMLSSMGAWEVTGFLDDRVAKGTNISGVPVIGSADDLRAEGVNIVVAVGDSSLKQRIVSRLATKKILFPTLIHPTAVLQDQSRIQIDEGTVICAGVVLTVDIRIGKHVLVNLNSTVGHDAAIGDFSSVMPGVNIAGEVTIGKGVLIGSGANIMNRVSLGDQCKVGMGAVVLSNVEAEKTVAGVPARIIR